jgi:hypothetical protein
MATRANYVSSNAEVITRTVVSGEVVTAGYPVQFSATADQVQIANGAGDNAIGIALTSGAAGEQVQIAISGIAPVKVGTGGATQGVYGIIATDGVIDRTLGGGTTLRHILGKFLQTGVVGDMVGFQILPFASVSS